MASNDPGRCLHLQRDMEQSGAARRGQEPVCGLEWSSGVERPALGTLLSSHQARLPPLIRMAFRLW